MSHARKPIFRLVVLALAFSAGYLAIAPIPGAAQDQTPSAPLAQGKMKGMRKACRADYKKFCAGVEPGGGRIIACLRQHADALDPQCAQALTNAKRLSVSPLAH